MESTIWNPIPVRSAARALLYLFPASLLPAGTKVLLITVEYDQSEMSGPPFAVHPPEVEGLFAGTFEVEPLETSDIGPGRFAAQGVSAMREAAYELTRRGA